MITMITEVLNTSNLSNAYQQVRQNKGVAGVDKMTVQQLAIHIEANQRLIIQSILDKSYVPQPIMGVEIPKSNGKTRLLGIPTVKDRWLQQAVSQRLNAVFENDFEPHSYGFRPNKNLQQAVSQSLEYINDGYQDIVDIDLQSFFDEVNHKLLLQLIHNKVKCQHTMRLIRKWLRAPILINGSLYKRRKGIPQGSPLSPLLSNILLDKLDKELKAKGLRYVRYADDFSIYTKSKTEARRVGNAIFIFLKSKLRLPINRNKSSICKPVNFEVLGHGFVPTYQKGIKGKYQLVANRKSWQSLKRKLKYLTKKTIPISFNERLRRLAEVWRGWINNYRLASIQSKLKVLDEWLRNRLRYCIWHHWKKNERKRKNLIRLGVEQGQAYAWSRTRMGGWAVAQSPILGTTITLARLKRKGYVSMESYYSKVRT